MPKFVAVSRDRHAGKVWRRPTSYAFAAHQAVVPLGGGELAKVALEMPIGFIELGGAYSPVALMSPITGRNFFIGPSGQWLGGYPPAALRSYPFSLQRAQGRDDSVLCIDEESGLVVDRDETAESFFDGDGNPSAGTKAVLDFLSKVNVDRHLANKASAVLADAALIQLWQFSVKAADTVTPVNGLFRIDEARLNALDDAGFLKLRQSGALPLAYMHFLSLGNWTVFERLEQAHRKLAPPKEPMLSLDEFFTLPQSDTLRFN